MLPPASPTMVQTSPSTPGASRMVAVTADVVDPDDTLRPGAFAEITVPIGAPRDAAVIPQTAVLQSEKGHFVFTLDAQNKATMRPVQAGEWVGPNWTILSGLNAGDRVIVENLLKVQPGVQVAPAAGAVAAGAK